MSLVNKVQSKRLLAVHGWTGTVLGLLLYVVVLTGAVSVLAHEIGLWSASGKKVDSVFDLRLNDRLVELSEAIEPEYLEEVLVSPGASNTVEVFFHTHAVNNQGKMDELGVRFILDPRSLEVIEQYEGFGSDMPTPGESALEHFITQLHINMHAPDPWGLFITGVLGFVMLVASISGLILHKHLLKDLFVAPRYSSALLNKKDRHVLAGSWSLPFGFVLAFSGAFFSFAGAVGLPLVAMVSFGGDKKEMFETLVGAPRVKNDSPAGVANLDYVIADSIGRVGSQPALVMVTNWGRADAEITLFHEPRDREVASSKQVFNGVSGEYKREMPSLGQQQSLGSALFSWMHPLHFGTFAGLMSKITWVCLGLATCYVTLTGLQLWVQRREHERAWQVLSRSIPILGYGTPLALVGAAVGFLIALPAGKAGFWTAGGFLIAAAIAVLLGLAARGSDTLCRLYAGCVGVGLLLLPLLRMVTGGADWGDLLRSDNLMVISMDLLFIIGGAAALMRSRRSAGAPVGSGRRVAKVHL